MKKINLIILCALLASAAVAQKLDKFGSSIQKTVGPKTVRVPYTSSVQYLGYATKGSEEAVVDGKKYYYIYVWIPAVAPELGVRMMSPVGKDAPKKAIVSDVYKANASSPDFFDTYITLERSNIIKVEDITADKVSGATWVVLDRNDDSSEMPKQPSGSSYNSLLRYKSELSDPLKALTVGLYRIGFTTFKVGEVQGTFLAEVAAPIDLPGTAMDKTLEGLVAQLKK